MKRMLTVSLVAAALSSFPALSAEVATKEKINVTGTTVVELKDGGRITLDGDGHTYHVNAAGKRVRMKDGVVMQGKDGAKYLHKNDAVWKQITEKGTLAPNR